MFTNIKNITAALSFAAAITLGGLAQAQDASAPQGVDVDINVRGSGTPRATLNEFEQIDLGTPPIANVPYVSDFVYPDIDFGVETDEERIEYNVPTVPARSFYTDDWWDDRGVYNSWYEAE